jgi:hypothetical protein
MTSEDRLPLRWVHFREGPEGAGVYVHIADLLYFIEARGPDAAIAELGVLLSDRSGVGVPSRSSDLTS